MLEPTNSEILRAVESLDDKFTTILNDHEGRIKGAENYINGQIAVAKYVADNGATAQKVATPTTINTSESAQPTQLVKMILAIFALFSAIIALITYILQLTLDK